jgi:hypothetical protein
MAHKFHKQAQGMVELEEDKRTLGLQLIRANREGSRLRSNLG